MTGASVSEGRVQLDLFEGPLDLLLFLIRKQELDIHDIPIARVTQQYAALLGAARAAGVLDLDAAGEYFLLLASLIQIKARMLLPAPPPQEAGEPEEDPRVDLVRQLLELERYREAAMMLRERAELAAAMHSRPDAAVLHLEAGEPDLEVDLLALARAFRSVLEQARLRTPHVFSAARYTVADMMRHVLDRVRSVDGDGLPFPELFVDGTIEEAVVTFLAVLELVKRGALRCRQDRRDDTLFLHAGPTAEAPT